MNEELLSWLWEFRVPALPGLRTISGEPVHIIHPGYRNSDAGPDYHFARIRHGESEWAGQVELHVRSSHWESHGHSADPHYRNIILHVVWEQDRELPLIEQRSIPTLELKPVLEGNLPAGWESMRNGSAEIACEGKPQKDDPMLMRQWLDRMASERLVRKAEGIEAMLKAQRGNWEETLYRQLAYAYGLSVNAQAMEYLARQVPMRLINRCRGQEFRLEAMLFGVAGLLPSESGEEYPSRLCSEFETLRRAHDLLPIDPPPWKYLRMHPSAFPEVRIARFAALLRYLNPLISLIHMSAEEMGKVFSLPPHAYWTRHFRFGSESVRTMNHGVGILSELVMVNAMAPFLHVYGRQVGNDLYTARAMDLLESVKPSGNRITRKWESLGVRAETALDSQGLIEAHRYYCSRRKCLSCIVGKTWLKEKTIYGKQDNRVF